MTTVLLFRFLKKAIIVICLCQSAIAHASSDESFVETLQGVITPGQSITTTDDKYNLPLAQWNTITNLSVENIISLDLRNDLSQPFYYYNKPFTCTVHLAIQYYTTWGQQVPSTISDVQLTVNYDTATGAAHKAIAQYPFQNAFKVTVTVTSISFSGLGNTNPDIMRIRNQILIKRKYPFSTIINAPVTIAEPIVAAGRGLQPTGNGKLEISWNPQDFPGAEEYDVEWTFIDKESDRAANFNSNAIAAITDEMIENWMRNDNSRVTVNAASYTIDLPYQEGYVLVRLRGAAYLNSSRTLRQTTNWQYRENIANAQLAYFATTAHQSELNWQFTSSFAEGGKRKEVISYFDGTLRSRQIVTINNSDDKSVAAETIYDQMGRPVLSILPSPINDNALKYYGKLNVNNAGDPFSHTDILLPGQVNCYSTAAKIYGTATAPQYYSVNNPFINSTDFYFSNYVPDANGYNYALTEYTPDNTGRIRRQGGVGETFQIGNGKETKYYYGKPLQTELYRLFGMEVGNSSHYQKNLVIDANGQASVSYVDASGRTIATALAGSSPATLQALPSALAQDARKTMNQVLLRNSDFEINAGSLYKQATATFLVAEPGDFQLNYSIDPASLGTYTSHTNQSFCTNCYYDVRVTIKDECGIEKASKISTPFTGNDIVCHSSAAVFTDHLLVYNLGVGEYTVSYTIQLSEQVINSQVEYYIDNNKDIKKLQSFFEDELVQADLKGCYNECATCMTKLGTLQDFTDKMTRLFEKLSIEKYAGYSFDPNTAAIQTWMAATYVNLYSNCIAISQQCLPASPCDQNLEMMKYDVIPGGQYALYNYNEASGLYSIVDDNTNVLKLYNTGIAAIDALTYTNNEGVTVGIKQNGVYLPVSDFISQYINHPEWADEFVKYHIEYCNYLWCKDQTIANAPSAGYKNEDSYRFDEMIRENIADAQTAVVKGYYSYTDYTSLLNADPFFNGGRGSSYKSSMQTDMATLSAVLKMTMKDANGNAQPVKNIFQLIDWMLYAKPVSATATDADIVASWAVNSFDEACRSRTQEWELYRNYYLQVKSKYVAMAKAAQMPECSNCFVGSDGLDNACSDTNTGGGNGGSGGNSTGGNTGVCPLPTDLISESELLYDYSENYSASERAHYSHAIYYKLRNGPATKPIVITVTPSVESLRANGNGVICSQLQYNYLPSYQLTIQPGESRIYIGETVHKYEIDLQTGCYSSYDPVTYFSISFSHCEEISQPPPETCPTSIEFSDLEELVSNNSSYVGTEEIVNMAFKQYYVHNSGPVTVPVVLNVVPTRWSLSSGSSCSGQHCGSCLISQVMPSFEVVLQPGQDRVFIGDILYRYSLDHSTGCYNYYLGRYSYVVSILRCEETQEPPTLPTYPSSSCTSDPRYIYYKDKKRIWNEYVNMQGYIDCIAATGITTSNTEAVQKYYDETVANLDALKESWRERLYGVVVEETQIAVSNSTIDNLVNNLYAIAKKNIDYQYANYTANTLQDISIIRAASVLPPGVTASNGYNNFSEAFYAIVGAANVAKGFGPDLLEQPYPYNRMAVLVNKNDATLSAEICSRLNQLKTLSGTGDNAAFHEWLKLQLADDYTWSLNELSDVLTRCTTGCRYTDKPLLFPAVLTAAAAPLSHPWVTCNDMAAIQSGFTTLYPQVINGTKLYRLLYTNYINHQLGYTLSYYDIAHFNEQCEGNTAAILFNKPGSPAIQEDDFACTAGVMADVFTRAGEEYEFYITREKRRFKNLLIAKCLTTKTTAKLQGQQYEYHYTLYYYDQAGNLVKTIPPEGVRLLDDAATDNIERLSGEPLECTNALQPQYAEIVAALNAFSNRLTAGDKAIELWLNGETKTRVVTPDNKYMLQAAIADGKLRAELYQLQPEAADGISIISSMHLAGEINAAALSSWNHVVIQSPTNFFNDDAELYLNGIKLSAAVADHYPYDWEIAAAGGSYTLPQNEIAAINHLRVYNRVLSATEVMAEYASSCLSPTGALASYIANSGPLSVWYGDIQQATEPFIVPDHLLATVYYYNSQDQVVKQSSPDGGMSEFYYDRLGRLTISQNEEQRAPTANITAECTNLQPSYTEANAAFVAMSNRLAASDKSIELWIEGRQQTRIITPDNKYMLQAAMQDGKLWVELYSLQAEAADAVSIIGSMQVVADATNVYSRNHLVIQNISSLLASDAELYLNAVKLTNSTSVAPYPVDWEINVVSGNYTLPSEDIVSVKQLRIYNRPLSDAEVLANYNNDCAMPVNALSMWASFEPVTTPLPEGNAIAGRYSYTKYDAIGRITEVGEKINAGAVTETQVRNENFLAAWLTSGDNKQVTLTHYDNEPAWLPSSLTGTLHNLRKRVTATTLLPNGTATERGAASYYSYDIQGNVKILVQENSELAAAEAAAIPNATGLKQIKYEYDLISGKVNKVLYQDGKFDQFYYQYLYDADNRLIKALSSRNNFADPNLWVIDATYRYYLHGPLARMELGNDKVQGVDYAYTLQGWLKGVNSIELDANKDMGGDGKANTPFANVGRDVFGFSLGYYNNDYKSIANTTSFSVNYQYSMGSYAKELFNGNIGTATYALSKINNGQTTGYAYSYDQLNRIKEMNQHNIAAGATAWSNVNATTAYREQISYDANGNILTYKRNAAGGLMDDMSYGYNRNAQGRLVNNKLRHVNDGVNANAYAEDIDNQQSDNYRYDKIGNLVSDKAEKIERIQWNVYGKISSIQKTGTTIEYGYDASGNRITKTVNGKKDFYVRDAQGNVLALYEFENSSLKWAEQHLYGSSMLGIRKKGIVANGLANDNYNYTLANDPVSNGIRGNTVYHISNHLGNVMATITDRKMGVDVDNDGQVDHFEAEVIGQSDYGAFGMKMKERSYGVQGRYGFNGMEKDNEISGESNKIDFGARIFDSQLGRWMSVDPLQLKYPELSPYNFVANSPVNAVDPDGRLIIFINGLRLHEGAADQGRTASTPKGWFKGKTGIYKRSQERNGTLEQYWQEEKNAFGRKVDIAQSFIERIGDDNAYFASGSAEWGSQANPSWFERNILGDESRYKDGVNKAKQFHKMVKKGQIKLTDNETIKIVTHSQGGAHGEGFARQLMSYKDRKGNSLYKVEVIYNITPHQPKDIANPEGVRGVQYSHRNDAVSSSGIIVDQVNGGSSFGKIEGITEFDGRKIIGGQGQPEATGIRGNRNGHNVTDNDFIFGIAPGNPGYVAPRKDIPKTR